MIIYDEIKKARLTINAKDCTYSVKFWKEEKRGWAFEFDPMSDAAAEYRFSTGNIRIEFVPVKETMAFPEDANRPLKYIMPKEAARDFYKFLCEEAHLFWFALDMASYHEKINKRR